MSVIRPIELETAYKVNMYLEKYCTSVEGTKVSSSALDLLAHSLWCAYYELEHKQAHSVNVGKSGAIKKGQPIETSITPAKTLLKTLGIKGCRKLALKQPVYIIGKQTQRHTPAIAHALLDGLETLGYRVQQISNCRTLASRGHLDCVQIDL